MLIAPGTVVISALSYIHLLRLSGFSDVAPPFGGRTQPRSNSISRQLARQKIAAKTPNVLWGGLLIYHFCIIKRSKLRRLIIYLTLLNDSRGETKTLAGRIQNPPVDLRTGVQFASMYLQVEAKRVARFFLGLRVKNISFFLPLISSRIGLEVGGPSSVFGDAGIMPIYRHAARIDNAVFDFETYWEARREEGNTFSYHPKKPNGSNYIREASDLRGIPDAHYSFLLASHILEHTANPVKTLKEWQRVVIPGSPVIVILPHHRHTFDRHRKPTSVDHMLEDYQQNRDESDLTHVQEVLDLQEFTPTDKVPDRERFKAMLEDNARIRLMHHHVFDEANGVALLKAAGLTVLSVQFIRPHHIVLVAQK